MKSWPRIAADACSLSSITADKAVVANFAPVKTFAGTTAASGAAASVSCTGGGITWPALTGTYVKYGRTPTSGGAYVFYVPTNLNVSGNTICFDVTDGKLGDTASTPTA